MVGEASATKIVELIIFGGSFVTAKAEPNDFDCVAVLSPKVEYESLTPAQRSIADTRQASRRYSGDVFVAKANQSTLVAYLTFLATNREGKQVGLIEVKL